MARHHAFRIDPTSGLPPYLQLVRQVRHALRLGALSPGDRLPTVKELAATISINQNTVLKAYRELEHDELVTPRPGVGTFISATPPGAVLTAHEPLRDQLRQWLATARRAGWDDETIEALFETTLHDDVTRVGVPLKAG